MNHRYTIGIVLMLLLCFPQQTYSQQIHAFISSGLNLSQIEGDELKGFRQVGYVGGVGALTALDKNYRWGLSVEALFSQRGAYNNSIDPYYGRITLNYIDIPLLFHYQDPYGGMLLGAGVSYGRLVQQPHGELAFNPLAYLPDTSDMTFLKNDLAVVLDMRFTIWKGLQFNIRWQYSLFAVKRDWTFIEYIHNKPHKSVNDFYNHSLTMRLIWQF